MARGSKPPSQTWRTLLENQFKTMVSVDFFTVPTIRFQLLYVFLVLAHDRRRILHFAVTAHPTAEWTAQQLREAFPWDSAPRFLLRDRDRIFGSGFTQQVEEFGMEEVLGAPGVCRCSVRTSSGSWARFAASVWTCDRLQRSVLVSASEVVPGVLSPESNALVAGEGPARESVGAAAGVRTGGSGAAGWRAASSVRTSRRLNRGVMSSGVTAPTPLPRSHRGAVAALDRGAKPV